jgi:Bacterial SH3 domain
MVDKKNENTSSKVEQNIGQNLKAEGNISLSNITQIGQQVVQQKLDFFELDLEKYQPSPEFTNLKITSELIDSIKDNRLLVLGESPNVDLATFAKYLGCYWSNQQLASTTQKLVVKEWYRNSDPQSIDVELQNTKESTVFILTQVSPQNIVGYSLQQIQQAALSSSHYVIVTTDTPLVAWRLPERAKTFWHELTVEDVADSQELVNKLTDQESIHEWYYRRLQPREQLLALGLSFFDGLFDDQFFAALEEVVENAWQRRDTGLRALDYCDLDNLRSFFNFTETNTQRTFVEIRFPKQRQMLLKVAWKSHRRLILAALPILVNLVKNSVRRYERELYGSSVRCDQLRRVIGETISDIGLIASDAVEDTLLNIAADQDINVQAVAAQAMALWRDDNKREFIVDEITNHHIDRQLFETLQRWQKEARVLSLVNAILDERNQKDSKQPVDYIRATIALTVGYAALYDPADQLSPELLELLKHLITEQNELVRNRVFTFTLPRLISRHIIQLRDILHDMLRYIDDSVLAVANGLAFAYRFRPNDVLETLTLWNSECKEKRPNRINITEVTSREVLLATVALTYGKIECDKSIGTLTPLVAVQHLKIILLEELHPHIREIALFAIGCQANRAFDQVEPELEDLVSRQITQKERQEVAEILTEIYLEQRFQLLGGEQTIKIDNKKYPVWLNSTRPLTTVEQAMVHWVKNKQNPMAQQVATNAIANFASKLDKEEERQIKQLREGRDPLETTSITVYANPIEGGKPPQDLYYGKLIPWLATRNAENYRTAIRNLLPEGLRQYKISRDIMDFVLLQKWGNVSDADVRAISKKLKSGLWWAENLVWFVAFGIVGVLILVGVAAINLSKSPGTTTLTEAIPTDPSIIVSDRASVSDVDSANFKTGKLIVKLSPGSNSDDRLGIRNQGKDSGKIGVSVSDVTYGGTSIGRFEGGKGTEPLIIDFNANASLEAVQALMRNITYQNIAVSPNLGSRTVEFQVSDDGNASSPKTLTRNIFVTRENTAPTLIVPDRQAVNENAPLNISGISINDSDSTKNFTVTLTVNNGTITIKDSVPKGLTADNISDNNTKTIKLVGSSGKIKATLTDPTAVIYKGTSDDTLSITVNDGGQDTPKDADKTLIWPPKAQDAKTSSKEIQIAVNPANKPPIITISEPTKIVNEDENLTINGIAIDDSDTQNLTVKLGVEHGTITVKTNAAKGLTANEISGNKTGTVTLTGDIAKIKATLADLQAITYRGIQDFNGNDTLTINIDDRGKGKTDKLNITVNPVNDPPVLGISTTVDTPQEVKPKAEDSSVNNKPTPEQSQQPADGKTPNATIVGTPEAKNIRSGAGTDYKPLHTAYPGDRIRVIGKGYDRGGYLWYNIYFPKSGASGWIGAHLVQVDAGVQP